MLLLILHVVNWLYGYACSWVILLCNVSLVTHAFFKCLLFFVLDHYSCCGNEQDTRKLSIFIIKCPYNCNEYIGSLALGGIPAMAGYYSKDLLLEAAYSSGTKGFIVYFLACLAAICTIGYSIKLLYLGFFSEEFQGDGYNNKHIHESSWFMLVPKTILAVLSIISGYLLRDAFTGPINDRLWNTSLAFPSLSTLTELEYVSTFVKYIPTTIVSLTIIFAIFMFRSTRYFTLGLKFIRFVDAAKQRFYFDSLQNGLFSDLGFKFAYFQYKSMDRGLLGLFEFPSIIKNLLFNIKYIFVNNLRIIIFVVAISLNILLLFHL